MFKAIFLTTLVILTAQVPMLWAQDSPIVNLVTNHNDSSVPTIALPDPVDVAPAVSGPYSAAPIMFEPMPMGFDPMLSDDMEIVQGPHYGEYIARKKYEMPTVKFTIDGWFFSRVGGIQDEVLLTSAPFPATAPALTSSELNLENKTAGRAEVIFYGSKQEIAPRASLIWTGDEVGKGSAKGSNGGSADINFFDAFALEPAEGYNVRNESKFMYGDIGLRKTISPAYGISFSLAGGKIDEQLDLVEQSSLSQDAGDDDGNQSDTDEQVGFYSQVDNKFYGFELGLDGQLWSNGYLKLDGRATAGVFYNDMKVAAQALNAQQKWEPNNTAFIGTLNLALVIPADPFNFRFGYQAVYADGIAMAVSQSRQRSLFSSVSDNATESVWYHGFLAGIEILR